MNARGRVGETARRARLERDGLAGAFARRALRSACTLVTLALVLLSLGAATGRWQVLPVRFAGDGIAVSEGSLVMVVPVASLSLHEGDAIYVRVEDGDSGLRRIGSVVDSWAQEFEIEGEDGRRDIAKLPPKVWRVSRSVPYAGTVFGLLVGPLQSLALVLVGLGLIALTDLRHATRSHRRQRLNRPRRGADRWVWGPRRTTTLAERGCASVPPPSPPLRSGSSPGTPRRPP